MNFQLQQRNILFIIFFLVAVWRAPASQALVVSEIMYHPVEEGGTSQGAQLLEFIELYNNRAVFENLSGYTFSNDIEYTFPAGTILGAKEYLVIAKDPNIVETTYGITGVIGPYDKRLNDDGDRIELSNEVGEIILTFRFNDARPWTIIPDGTGHSLILAKLGGDPEEASTWASSTCIGGSPGGPDEIHTTSDPNLFTLVYIGHSGRYFKGYEEPSPGGGGAPTLVWAQIEFDDDPATTDWIDGPSGYGYSNEQEESDYIQTELNDMSGNYISVYARLPFTLSQEQINSFAELQAEVHYDDDYILFLNGTPVGNSTQIPEIPLAYNWGRGVGNDYATAYHDLTGWLHLLEVGENILAIQVHNSALSSSSDGYGAPVLKAVIEDPGNNVDPLARIVINEVLANSEVPPATDWIELYNPGPEDVNTSEMKIYLSDDRFDLLKYKLPDGILLEPGDFLVVDEGTAPDGFPFGIGYSDEKMEKVYVTMASDNPSPVPVRVLDVLRPDNSEPEATSGRYPDGSDYLGILSSSTKGNANTPHRIHDIVINEIMYHHGLRDRRYEYIELYNRSTTDTIPMEGWEFTDGVNYTFPVGISMPPNSYLVIAEDPAFLATKYPPENNLEIGVNLLGPYSGNLNDHSERIQLSYSYTDPNTQLDYYAIADEVTYYDGGRWPSWADGEGASLELLDPDSDNDTPDAWADSDESGKSSWQEINFSIDSTNSSYTHDTINVFGMILLNRGEVLLDDIELIQNDTNFLLDNSDFESGIAPWNLRWVSNYNLNLGGNHIRSFISTEDSISGSHCLHLIATGHGDPGANRINQTGFSASGGKITFKGWARWLRGSRFLLLRTSNDLSPKQPPRPAYVKELNMPVNLGTPGLPNSTLITNRGPDIREIQHTPVLPTTNEDVVVTARVTDNDGVDSVLLGYRSEGSGSFSFTSMVDNGTSDDMIAGDGLFTGTIPGVSTGMRAFYIEAFDGDLDDSFFPSDAPDRTCLVRINDTIVSTPFATYRVWISDDVINAFTSRPNLSNELMDCTFVYNDTEVFYNTHIRLRGSPFLRGGSGRNPTHEHAYRIEFNPDQKFRMRQEINLDNTEGNERGPLQERASYWFHRKMGLQYSMGEFIKPILNGNVYWTYEDVQKIDGDYINAWFPDDNDGYIHKIDDYFEYNVQGTSHSNWDEGLIYNPDHHPLIPETYRWGFEKRSHRENDTWGHLFSFAYAMNTESENNGAAYEAAVESQIDPLHFARVLAVRHACGDWDSYGYNRGKNNYFYYAPNESKWYLLPWDIDFTLGGRSHYYNRNIYEVSTNSANDKYFPEVKEFLDYPKYRAMYDRALEELVYGPWQTSYGTADPPTPFDIFLADADSAQRADGYNSDSRLYTESGRPDGIFPFVRERRSYIISLLPDPPDFEITTNSGLDFCISQASVTLEGIAPFRVAGIAVNGTPVETVIFSDNNAFEITVDLNIIGQNPLTLQGLDSFDNPLAGETDSITIKRIAEVTLDAVTPNLLCNDGPEQLTIYGNNFDPGAPPVVDISLPSNEIGFNALYVKSFLAFDGIGEASSLLDNPQNSSEPAVYGWHPVLNLFNSGIPHGEFPDNEYNFYPPYDTDNSNYAVRFTGYIEVPSPGIRYFGVNSDEGFSLTINGELVGSYPGIRTADTTDVTNVTVGTMSYDFPAAGKYYLVLDYFENSQGEEIEFFQTNEFGLDRRLINVDSELTVYGDDLDKVNATNVIVTDPTTITCQVDLTNVPATLWNIIVTPDCDRASRSFLEDVLLVTEPTTGSENWDVWPTDPVVSAGLTEGTFEPNQITFEVVNLSMNSITWTISKDAPCDWLDLPEVYYGTNDPNEIVSVSVSLNENAKTKSLGVYSCLLNFSIGCNPGSNQYQREVQLLVTCGADFNRDTLVNLLDLKQLADRWGNACSPSDWCDWIDLDFSGRIDLGDYVILAQQWLQDAGQP